MNNFPLPFLEQTEFPKMFFGTKINICLHKLLEQEQ